MRQAFTIFGKLKFTDTKGKWPGQAQNNGRARRRMSMNRMLRLFRDEAGATAIEYGLIAALIAVAAISAMQGFGNEFKTTFNTASSAMANGNSGA